jgi:CheY-like chemotaxis protein
MVAKRPGDRYATMAEVVAALERARGLTDRLDLRPGLEPPGRREPAHGATVFLDPAKAHTLEITPGDPPGPAGAVPSSSEIRRVSDLIVVLAEPSRLQSRVVCGYLDELGIRKVSRTASGAEALEMVRREGAQILLSAAHLADMTGAELARALHASPEGAGVAFVLASSDTEGGRSNVDLLDSRMGLLRKPFDLRDLARALAEATGRSPEEILSGGG